MSGSLSAVGAAEPSASVVENKTTVAEEAPKKTMESMESELRTPQAILDRLRFLSSDFGDVFGVRRNKLIYCLPYDKAKPFIKDSIDATHWATVQTGCTRSALLAELTTYMPFAWDKANDCRGLSANRSMEHFEEWLWLLGDDQSVWKKLIEPIRYEHYGKERLIKICQHYGILWEQWDDGARVN